MFPQDRTRVTYNLVPRARVSFGQHRVLVLTKRHVGSGNEVGKLQKMLTAEKLLEVPFLQI